MTANELLNEARRLGVTIELAGDRLRYRAPRGAITDHFRQMLGDRRSELIALLRNDSPSEPTPPLRSAAEECNAPFPLTEIQQAYLIGRSATLELGNVACHGYQEFDIADCDLARFRRAVDRLIERHDMLRLVILPDGQQQVLATVPQYQLQVDDLRGQSREDVQRRLDRTREAMSHQVLPTDRWPLFEIRASLLDDGNARFHASFDLLLGDAWSFQIFFRELHELYENPEAPLEPLTLSFRECVMAELEAQASAQYQRSKEYWLERLPNLPPTPELPLQKSPKSLTRPRFSRRTARLERKAWQHLKARAGQAKLTPSGILCAALVEVLAVWSGRSRFTLNLTLVNRFLPHSQINDIIGDFTTTLLLAVENSEGTFEERAHALQEQLWNDLSHSAFSGISVLRELNRQQGGAPRMAMPVVFSSALINDRKHNGAPTPFLRGYGISQTPQVLIDHQMREDEGALVFNWDAVDEAFPEGFLDGMFAAYSRLVHSLADEETTWQESRSETSRHILPPDQLRARAVANSTDGPVSDELLQVLFARQAALRPDEPAVVASGRSVSYGELSGRANQVAHWLRQHGARPNTLVAVVMEKGWEQMVAVLGVLGSGAAYLPIDPGLPAQRLAYLLEHGEVTLALTQSRHAEKLEGLSGLKQLCVDTIEAGDLPEEPLAPVQKPTDLAYVIYTSGSTGLPKGVMIDHRGAVNTILDVNSRFNVKAQDRVLALSALGFDLSVYDVFGTLAAGGTIVLPDPAANRDPAHWAELLKRERVSVWNSVPALMEMLVEYLRGRSEPIPESLRLVLLSGDWIPVSLPGQIKALGSDICVISLGGATEASIWSILYPIEDVDPAWKSIPYGRPMVNQRFHVLNEHFEPCPEWVPGQLYIAGIGLAQGYWRDPEKTAASFITHPRTGERLYRTGDLGRYLPSGDIEFLGREDFQVKIRGHRIELGEIEAVLLQHPRVKEAVAAVVGEKYDRRLVAYVVPDTDAPAPDVAALPHTNGKKVDENAAPIRRLTNPVDRLKFKLSKPALRKNAGMPTVALKQPDLDDATLREYVARRTYRKYSDAPVSFAQFSAFLSSLASRTFDGLPFPKYRYASAGGVYPVQTYVYVKPGRVTGISPGTYYYNPATHQLLLLNPDAAINASAFPHNDAIFDSAAFALFLVGEQKALAPLYEQRWARDFCMLEAGLICQLLEASAPAHQLGMCQIGGLDFSPIRNFFDLSDSQEYLHCLLGGCVSAAQTTLQGAVDDSRGFLEFVELTCRNAHEESGDEQPTLTSDSISAPAEFPADQAFCEELRQFVVERLTDYMVPSALVLMHRLPLTANGKVNRQALPAPAVIDQPSATEYVAPRSENETVLAAIWQELLDVDRVGVHDNFFELGGNSITAIRLIAKAGQAGLRLAPVQVFEHQTIAELAAALESPDQGPSEPPKNGGAVALHRESEGPAKSAAADFDWTEGDLAEIRRAISAQDDLHADE